MTLQLDRDAWGQYINYPDPRLDQTTAQTSYWAQHLTKLQDLKQQIDPHNLFHYPQGVLPASMV